jgi:hypothetical protein
MATNIDQYKKDLEALIGKGEKLSLAMETECFPEQLKQAREKLGDKADEFIKTIPSFRMEYQAWYSEAKALIKQLLPDRLSDFVRHYEKPKSRKGLTNENYTIEDYLQGLSVTRGLGEKVVGPDAAISHMHQQHAILKSIKARFESSLFDIRQLVQADLFDSELDAAKELAKNNFTRAAGALAGVVLERHLAQISDGHGIKFTKKNLSISDLNDALKDAKVIDIPQWRFIQHLADIRNLCDHSKKIEPTSAQVDDLVAGVMKITKTVF